jgi:hypothetical protein
VSTAETVLGIIDDPTGGYASDEPDARKIPGLTIHRYNASIVFFNADTSRIACVRCSPNRRRPGC